ncbi:MAG: hypothetical protein ABI877_22450, partial [Gemmatimonadaceae bacterium]
MVDNRASCEKGLNCKGRKERKGTQRDLRKIDVAALTAAIRSIVLGVASSHALNADGVSYLDLASAVRDGDWTS